MTKPSWMSDGSTFWKRNYELATIAEDAISSALAAQLEQWLSDLEKTDGKAAKETV